MRLALFIALVAPLLLAFFPFPGPGRGGRLDAGEA